MSDMVYMRIYAYIYGKEMTGQEGAIIRDRICCIFVNNNNNNISCITSPTFEAYTRRSTA